MPNVNLGALMAVAALERNLSPEHAVTIARYVRGLTSLAGNMDTTKAPSEALKH